MPFDRDGLIGGDPHNENDFMFVPEGKELNPIFAPQGLVGIKGAKDFEDYDNKQK